MWKRKRKRGVGAGIKGADGRKGQGWTDAGKEGDRGKEQEGKRKGMETQSSSDSGREEGAAELFLWTRELLIYMFPVSLHTEVRRSQLLM